ncbi:hypothetical protein HN51_003701 [Arachis hypogaea]|uniref:Peptidase A1 domain-containing protein n=2 Tax=Arachis TaxID=3817 RepID=A0A445DK07_ARAHY|nr:aspartyl protease family protein At5g10770 [Arachis hypogaea]QHO37222.1 uncharacterized protein DS421_4g109630 [Arachis hypogaea]RYR63509.1 hypothetical protein Ahy_A04g021324 [Arachis hypogaea]
MGNFHFFLLCILVLNFVPDSVHKSVAFQSDDTTTTQISNHFNVVEVSSLLPTSTCNPSSKQVSSEEEESLELVHNYGPCSPKNHGKANAPSMLEILDRDQKRASLMVSRQRYGKNQVQLRWQDSTYVINVGIGTPKRMFTFNIDTGSDLLWIQCLPCKLGKPNHDCYQPKRPLFDPSKSSTYTKITCPSHTCSLTNTTLGYTQCVSSSCTYLGAYLDGSLIFGYMAKETLFVGSKTFKGIMFGCNEVTFNATLDKTDGIIGLGQGFLSFVEQTSNTYNKVFSYCLPSNPNRVGFLRFGKTKRVSKSLKFTKLGRDNAIELTGIKVGSTTIPITVKKDTAFIDSGTVITRLPSKDYIKLREAYRKAMTGYRFVGAISVADTCYNVGGHKKLKLPRMSFLFADGLLLDIPPSGVVIPYNSTVVCFPFAATPETPGGEDFVLLGNYQQRTLEVVYDVAGGKLGFGHGGCK